MFRVKCASAITVLVSLCLGSSALADDLPVGARAPSVGQVASFYAGKTDLWRDNCGGGIYYAPNGSASAWCGENPDNIGSGPWSVKSDGRLCTDLNWFWPNPNGSAGSSSGGTNCILHVSDPLGGLWRSWDGKEWWRMKPSTSGLKSGYVFRGEVDQARGRLGL